MANDPYDIKTYDYTFDESIIAGEPLEKREQARLLIKASDNSLAHHHVIDLAKLLSPGDLVVLNNTRVFPARLFGTSPQGAKVEVFLLEKYSSRRWLAMGKPLKKIKKLSKITFGQALEGRPIFFGSENSRSHRKTLRHSKRSEESQKDPSALSQDDGIETASNQSFVIEFNFEHADLMNWLEQWGHIPLPPYIKRQHHQPAHQSSDKERYQTAFAKHTGSVAAPTAGLHFSQPFLRQLADRGINTGFVTLHVGAGTFLPVKTDDIRKHTLHQESFYVPKQTFEKINTAKQKDCKVIFVGTTTLRCLESLHRQAKHQDVDKQDLCDQWLATNLYLRPPNEHDLIRPWAMDALMTNFHQPKSSLFILVSALFGIEPMKQLYQVAQQENYRFFSYGDACLLWLPTEN